MVDDPPARPLARPAFKTADGEVAFFAVYDAVLDQWPVAVEAVDVASEYGSTRVHVCGPADGTPLVLLHGGGATSTVWFANVADLGSAYRVYAVDQIGDAGKSVHNGRRISALDDLMAWLDAVLDHLGIDRAHLCGHSVGAWIALNYALRSPHRVHRLALLDPTQCFAGMRLNYLVHAVPLLARPSARRLRAFIAWETAGIPVDPTWLRLACRGADDFPRSRTVLARRPDPERLRASTVPTLVLLAENSRSHDIRRVSANAHRLMPHAVTRVLPGASHHSIPTAHAAELNQALLEFLS